MEVEDQEFAYEGEHWWTARDRVVFARMEQYLDRSESMKVEKVTLKAMHEENFLSSWLREDGEDKKERQN